MNDEDMHDILEAIDQKQKSAIAMDDLAHSLGVFRKSLINEGFTKEESLGLVAHFMSESFKSNFGGF